MRFWGWKGLGLSLLYVVFHFSFCVEVRALTLENSFLKVEIDEKNGSWSVLEKQSGTRWASSSEPPLALIPKGLSKSRGEAALLFEVPKTLGHLAVVVKLNPGAADLSFTINGDPEVIMKEDILYPPALSSRAKDLVMIPYGEGQVFEAKDLEGGTRSPWAKTGEKSGNRRWGDYNEYKTSMAFACVTDGKSGYGLMVNSPMDSGVHVIQLRNLLALQPRWYGQKGKLGYSREVIYHFSPKGGHTALAKRYRALIQRKGWLVPFSKKKESNPNLHKLLGAVNLWALDSKLPKNFFEDLAASGVKKAVVSLGGSWQGPQGQAKTIEKLKTLGYLPSRYDIYVDVWNGADGVPTWLRTEGYPDEVIVDADGSLQKGWVDKSQEKSFQGYRICSNFQAQTARRRIAEDLKENKYLARFIDVVCATGLTECFHPKHRTTRMMDHHFKNLLLSVPFREFKLVTGTEEIREWAVRFSDFSEGTMTKKAHSNAGYDWGKSVEAEPGYMDENFGPGRVPLFELVYHEAHVTSWYTGDGYSKVPEAWEAKEAMNVLYGTMPLWMPSAEQWKKYRGKFLDSYRLVNSVFEAVGGSEMLSHEFLSPDRLVQRTVFSSGHTVTANFGPNPWPLDKQKGTSIPLYGFFAEGPNLLSFRVLRGAVLTTSARDGILPQ